MPRDKKKMESRRRLGPHHHHNLEFKAASFVICSGQTHPTRRVREASHVCVSRRVKAEPRAKLTKGTKTKKI